VSGDSRHAAPSTTPAPAPPPLELTADALTFGYGRRRPPVLSDLSWTIAPGTRTLLLGPNGAGKSTLLRLLSGRLRPRSGSVRIGGRTDRTSLYRHVGWMPQQIEPLRGFTVREQVELAGWAGGRTSARATVAAEDAIRSVRLDDRPDTRASHLSGGQLRRLGLAQVLARESDVLLLDEPTAGLDPAQTMNFREILREIGRHRSLVISTHQVSDLIEDVDRVAVLVDGTVRFDGPVADFAALGSGGTEPEALSSVFSTLVRGGLH